jgi:hypothetical protein
MTITPVTGWNTNPALNTFSDIPMYEGMPPNLLNDGVRAAMAAIHDESVAVRALITTNSGGVTAEAATRAAADTAEAAARLAADNAIVAALNAAIGTQTSAANGSMTIGGIVVKWGQVAFNAAGSNPNKAFTFNAPFPTECWSIVGNDSVTKNGSGGGGDNGICVFHNLSAAGATLIMDANNGSVFGGAHVVYYIAIGH